MKILGNTSLTKMFLLIKTYVKDSIKAIKPSDIGAAPTSHTHPTATTNRSGFMSTFDKDTLERINPITATSSDGIAYSATIPGISNLDVGLSFIMVPNRTSNSVNCTLQIKGVGTKPIRVHKAKYNGFVESPVHTNWLYSHEPVRMTYDGEYWVADVVNAATMDEVNTAIQSAIQNTWEASY